LTAASADGPASLEDGLRGATEIEAKRLAMRVVEGKLAIGDTSASFAAFYEGRALRHVEEQASYGEYGRGQKAYYLDASGVLFYYHAAEQRTVTRPGRSGTDEVTIRAVFDPAGNMRAAEKTVNGQSHPLQHTDLQGAIARLGALRTAAEVAALDQKRK
jgi:hypothetical protein